jgi:hypothetical protein
MLRFITANKHLNYFKGKSPPRPSSQSDTSEIRLVRLYPRNFDEQVLCDLEHFSLASTTDLEYVALSYAWGDPNITAPIPLDGEEYPVTINLQFLPRHAQMIMLAVIEFIPAGLRVRGPGQGLQCATLCETSFGIWIFLETSHLSQTAQVMELVKRHLNRLA